MTSVREQERLLRKDNIGAVSRIRKTYSKLRVQLGEGEGEGLSIS